MTLKLNNAMYNIIPFVFQSRRQNGSLRNQTAVIKRMAELCQKWKHNIIIYLHSRDYHCKIVQIECFQNMLTLFLLARTVIVPYDYRKFMGVYSNNWNWGEFYYSVMWSNLTNTAKGKLENTRREKKRAKISICGQSPFKPMSWKRINYV
jgi:hypothetical protein